MTILKEWHDSQKGAHVSGTIRCPRNYVLKQGHQPFVIIPNPNTKGMTDEQIDYLNKSLKYLGITESKLRRWTYKKDRHGNKIQDFDNYYQPQVSKAYALENIYDPLHPICLAQCKGRCLKGLGKVNINAIKRLSS